MEISKYKRMTIELSNDEIDSMREIVRLAHKRLRNAPRLQMHGAPLERQAGLVGPELFRVKTMLEKMGTQLGIELPYDAKPDDQEADQEGPALNRGMSLFELLAAIQANSREKHA